MMLWRSHNNYTKVVQIRLIWSVKIILGFKDGNINVKTFYLLFTFFLSLLTIKSMTDLNKYNSSISLLNKSAWFPYETIIYQVRRIEQLDLLRSIYTDCFQLT